MVRTNRDAIFVRKLLRLVSSTLWLTIELLARAGVSCSDYSLGPEMIACKFSNGP